jgi:uncharacterized protein (DUF1697 family)
MKRLIIGLGIMVISVAGWAQSLSQNEFKAQVKQHYASLELKLAQLNASVDQMEHPSLMIAKACEYATGLKQLKQFSEQNSALAVAQSELQFVSALDKEFEKSLQDLGTSYQKGCVTQKK